MTQYGSEPDKPEERFSATFVDGDVIPLPIDSISLNSDQPRQSQYDPGWKSFVESIEQYGVIEPVIVSINDNSDILLVAGERRLEAAKEAGLTEIYAKVFHPDKVDVEAIALVENIQRLDLNPVDRACAVAKLVEKNGKKKTVVAKMLGIDRTSIANLVKVSTLPDKIIAEVRKHDAYALRELIKIANIKDKKEQREAFKSYQATLGIDSEGQSKAGADGKRLRRPFAEAWNSQIQTFSDRLSKLPKKDKDEVIKIKPELLKLREQIDQVLKKLDK